MAILKNILLQESNYANCIHLYREGIFLIAYDWSAYLFTRYIKEYSVRKKYYKVALREVCSIGFPQKAFSVLIDSYKDSVRQTDEGYEINVTVTTEDREAFSGWEQGIAPYPVTRKPVKPAAPAIASETTGQSRIIEYIQTFDLANQTPMQCAVFVADIQKRIKQMTMESG